MTRRYCYPQCSDPWFNECADCWRDDDGIRPNQPRRRLGWRCKLGLHRWKSGYCIRCLRDRHA